MAVVRRLPGIGKIRTPLKQVNRFAGDRFAGLMEDRKIRLKGLTG
jgi:hypothetical protein